MKCYYDVLGVSRDVNDDDLKKTYRKLALKWHPDKNPDNAVEAKEQFQLVQQAYEILSDPQERSWYDNHRESILRGAGSDYKDDSLDVFQYFIPSCFKGYGDDDKGFYAVYREVFNKLAAEDSEYGAEEDSDFEVPSFGNSISSYDEVVRPFYAYWQGYSTKKSYAWLDPYDIRDAPNRRVVRAAEKENKKVRAKARKERNEEVRNLVAFVRKRDKRVKEHVKLVEQRAAENVKNVEERRKKLIKKRQEEIKNYQESEWAKFSNLKKELETIEADLVAEFGESEESICGDLENDEIDAVSNSLYCIACTKVFKTENAFQNHESSKKHKENIEILKASMLEEEKEEEAEVMTDTAEAVKTDSSDHDDIEVSSSDEDVPKPIVNIEEKPEEVDFVEEQNYEKQNKPNNNEDSDSDNTSDVEFDFGSGQSKKQRKKQRQRLLLLQKQDSYSEAGDNEEIIVKNEEIENVNFVDECLKQPSKKSERRKRAKETRKENKDVSIEGQNNVDIGANTECSSKLSEGFKIKNKKVKGKKGGKEVGNSMVQDVNHCCVTCHSEFPSKNKLFDHLKKSGHSVYIPGATLAAPKERFDERVKGKGRRSK